MGLGFCLFAVLQPAVEGENGMIRLLTWRPRGRGCTMRTAGVAVLADTAEIIKSCPFFGKGRRHSGEWDKQRLMILYEVFIMCVGNFHWLTSCDTEICWGLGFIFNKITCVYLRTFLEIFILSCKRHDVGQSLFLKLAMSLGNDGLESY